MKPKFFIPLLYLSLIAACRSPSTPEVGYSTMLRSDEQLSDKPLSNEEQEEALTAIESFETLPETRWSLFVQLCTEDYSRFRNKLPPKGYGKTIPLGDGTEYYIGTPPSFDDVTPSQNDPNRLALLLPIFHDPDEADQVKYFTYMLDSMEGSFPLSRKLSGLYNIQRVMRESQYYRNVKASGMTEVRNRLYALAEDEMTPDPLTKELNIWLEQLDWSPEEKINQEPSKSSALRFFEFQDDGSL
ncbi:hypothetical protein P3T73_03510 [Kiritimatiellota bacterium B12222]|nr:hypothetical protein P3T73_03510 [Kiritimatiellota bacterium B12222]